MEVDREVARTMERIGFNLYAEIALVLFAVAFLAILVRTILKSRANTREEARLPLDDGTRRKEDNG